MIYKVFSIIVIKIIDTFLEEKNIRILKQIICQIQKWQ